MVGQGCLLKGADIVCVCVFGVPPAVHTPVPGNRACGCGVVFARGRLERGSLQISSQLGLLTG